MDAANPWQDYVGRQIELTTTLDLPHLDRFRATLGLEEPDGTLPLGVHWCFGTETVLTDLLGPDGHPPKGAFLPDVGLPRRMWAGGALEVLRPLRPLQQLRRVSTIASVTEKTGKSGRLVFVGVDHVFDCEGDTVLRERQDIVYRPADIGPAPAPLPEPDALPEGEGWLLPSPPLLFRYSAITFNTHRIHYDLPYAQCAENYPGLVVHGPMQATLLAAAAAKTLGRPVTRFSFRGQAPAFAGHPLQIISQPRPEGGLLVSTRQFGKTCMQAEAV